MNDYAGNPAVYPALIPLIDDSDPPDASNFDPTGEALADRTAFLNALCGQFINGVTGGTYNPTGPIVIGGAGMRCPTAVLWEIDGNLYFDGTGSFHPELTLDGSNAVMIMQGGALMQVESGSAIEVLSTGEIAFVSGSILSLGSGTNATVATTLQFLTGSILEIEAGAHLQIDTTGQLNLAQGNAVRIADSTAPLYTTPLTRVIAQPIVCGNPQGIAGSFTQFGPDQIVDASSGGQGWLQLTKLINGATLDRILLRLSWASAHTAATPASMVLQRFDTTTGTSTTITSWTINTNTTPPGTFLIFSVSGGGTVIDDSRYTYAIGIVPDFGIGSQVITWFEPRLSFINIGTLGQY